MANIIRLQPRRRASAAPARPGKPATIIFFPGVRYERPHEGRAEAGSRGKQPPRKAN